PNCSTASSAMPRADAPADARLYLGLISGTSVDGIDAALVRFPARQAPELVGARTFAHAPALREEILALSQLAIAADLDRVGRLDHHPAAAFAQAPCDVLDE